jgi:hypothetical protein
VKAIEPAGSFVARLAGEYAEARRELALKTG